MNPDQAIAAFYSLILLTFIGISVLRFRNRRKKRILLTEYRRGVHFVDGAFQAVLGPGSYRYDERHEQITVMDMRPQPVLIERLSFQDALRHEGVISIGTELLIRDPRLAATALRDQVKDAYVMVRDTIRAAMSQQIADGSEDASSVAEALTKAVNAELSKVGVGISEIEITELFSPSARPQVAVGSELIQ